MGERGLAKPVPDGNGRKGRSLLSLRGVVADNIEAQGGSSEQISKVITYDMALSVPCCMGSQVPIPDFDGSGKDGNGSRDPGNMRFCGL